MTKLAALVLVAGALTAGGTAPVATSRPAVFGTLQQATVTRTALAMAEATITLGMATFIALFLFLDRE